MLGETKGSAMRQTWGKALGKAKKHAVTGSAFLGGVGLAHVVHKLREHRLPGASSHAGSGPRYSHRHPAAERIWTPGGGWTTSSGVPVDGR